LVIEFGSNEVRGTYITNKEGGYRRITAKRIKKISLGLRSSDSFEIINTDK